MARKDWRARVSLVPGPHPIIPVMLATRRLSQIWPTVCCEKEIYVVGFQLSRSYQRTGRGYACNVRRPTRAQLERAVAAFAVRRSCELNVIT